MNVDVVVMWVDGNDPEWIKEKNKYSPVKIDDSNSTNRFRDWGLMKYWFRSIEKYMPWIRKIFFVTWGHTPDFLKLNHPKLRIVKHTDFIPEKYLPTFSANPIEMNLHRIPDLSEHFILFNDDMFVTKPLSKSYFFKNGLPCGYYAEIPFGFIGKFEVWQMLCVNDLRILNKDFSKKQAIKTNFFKYFNTEYSLKDNIRSAIMTLTAGSYFTGFKSLHSPAAYCKSTFIDLWNKEYEILDSTSSHRFRSNEDVNQWLALWWQYACGKFSPQKMNCCTFSANENNIKDVCKAIVRQSYDMICINDPESETDYLSLSKKITKSFEKVLPQKSSFEV